MRKRIAVAVMAAMVVALSAGPSVAGSQMFPVKKGSRGLSAYLVKPTEGLGEGSPAGWKKITSLSYGNAALADECLTPESKDAACTTTSYVLPKSDYVVSVLMRGEGRARLQGSAEWTALKSAADNRYAWVELGTVKEATQVVVEVASSGAKVFFYGGLLAEGQVLPVVPVAKVVEKLKAGGPATVVLLGDSVTENSGGKGGGSSSFEKGNPGLMLALLKQLSGGEVDYLAHREPPSWAGGKDPTKIPTAEVEGKAYYDSRIELDASKKVHLVNLGKGGAASDWGWSRMGEVLIDNDYLDTKLPKEQHKDTVRFGLARYKPDVVFINFGTNDVNGVHGKWMVEDYLFHMKVLATNIQQRFGSAVVLSTPHKWTQGVHLGSHRQPAMVLALRAYCKATGLALADVYNEYGPGENDGIHPRDAGHKHIADAYGKALLGQASAPAIQARFTAAEMKDNGDGTVTVGGALMWTRDTQASGGPVAAEKAAETVAAMNAAKKLGHDDWRLPTRDELAGLVDMTESNPALPKGHPFVNVTGWYATSEGTWGVDMPSGVMYQAAGKATDRQVGVWAVRTGGGEL